MNERILEIFEAFCHHEGMTSVAFFFHELRLNGTFENVFPHVKYLHMDFIYLCVIISGRTD